MFKKKPIFAQAMPYIMPSLDTGKVMVIGDSVKETADAAFTIHRIQEIEREAYERGFESGQQAGFEMGEQKALLLIQRLEKAIADLADLRKKEINELAKQSLDISIAVAKRIVLRELTLSPDIITDIVKESLTRLQRTGQIIIRIHPSLHEIFIRNKSALITVCPDIVFELDANLPLYGAVVIGPEESIITDIEEQFKNILDDIGVKLARD